MKALIIEAVPLYQKILRKICSDIGFEVSVSTSGAATLALENLNEFDIICLSFQLGDMTGIELTHHLRESKKGFYTPIIMLTSEESNDMTVNAMSAGITEVYYKSDISVLDKGLREFIQNNTKTRKLSGRVMLAEDSPAIAQMVQTILESLGLEVDHVVTAEAGLELIATNDYDLIVTDIVLAGMMTGLALVRLVRTMSGNKGSTPILGFSGMDDTSRKVELLRLGANDYVSKPFLEEELISRVSNLVINKQLLEQVEEQKKSFEKMAMTDQLTGLYNRHFVSEMVPKMISEAQRHKIPLSVVAVDIDHFKRVNDDHGHAVGDVVLAAVGELLSASCRNEDIPARLGGEEFIILLAHCGIDDAVAKAEQIRKELMVLRPGGLDITSSFGVAMLSDDKQAGFDELVSEADKALYRAKENGRNRVEVA